MAAYVHAMSLERRSKMLNELIFEIQVFQIAFTIFSYLLLYIGIIIGLFFNPVCIFFERVFDRIENFFKKRGNKNVE